MTSELETTILCKHRKGNRIITRKLTSFEYIKNLDSGYINSRIGVILKDIDYNRYIFNISNRKLLSDFGGGIKKKETVYNGLKREISEEIPLWSETINSLLDDNVKCYVIESKFLENPDEKMISVLVFLNVDSKLIESFEPSMEVREIILVNEIDVKEYIRTYHRHLNCGLRQFQEFIHYIS